MSKGELQINILLIHCNKILLLTSRPVTLTATKTIELKSFNNKYLQIFLNSSTLNVHDKHPKNYGTGTKANYSECQKMFFSVQRQYILYSCWFTNNFQVLPVKICVWQQSSLNSLNHYGYCCLIYTGNMGRGGDPISKESSLRGRLATSINMI